MHYYNVKELRRRLRMFNKWMNAIQYDSPSPPPSTRNYGIKLILEHQVHFSMEPTEMIWLFEKWIFLLNNLTQFERHEPHTQTLICLSTTKMKSNANVLRKVACGAFLSPTCRLFVVCCLIEWNDDETTLPLFMTNSIHTKLLLYSNACFEISR